VLVFVCAHEYKEEIKAVACGRPLMRYQAHAAVDTVILQVAECLLDYRLVSKSGLGRALEKDLTHRVGAQPGYLDHASTIDLAEQRTDGDFG
jgi:hypothetical protein